MNSSLGQLFECATYVAALALVNNDGEPKAVAQQNRDTAFNSLAVVKRGGDFHEK